MTAAQRRVYDALLRLVDRDPLWPPSVRELAEESGLSSASTVLKHLSGLERDGWVERRPGRVGVRPTIRRLHEVPHG